MNQSNKNKNSNYMEPSSPNALQRIKTEIRNWYGSLSVKELVHNTALISEIEKLERLLAGKVVAG